MQPLKSKPVGEVDTARKAYDTASVPSRTTYGPGNAERFKPIFDLMIVTNQNQEILTAETRLKPSTLYISANDALRWLAECHPTEQIKYVKLRTQIRVRKTDRGVILYWRESLALMQGRDVKVEIMHEHAKWKDELVVWLQGAQPNEVFERRGIYVSPENNKLVTILLSAIDGVELEMGIDYIRVMR